MTRWAKKRTSNSEYAIKFVRGLGECGQIHEKLVEWVNATWARINYDVQREIAKITITDDCEMIVRRLDSR